MLSVQCVVASEYIKMASDILAMERFSDICVGIAHIVFHAKNFASRNFPLFMFWFFDMLMMAFFLCIINMVLG